MAAPPARSEVAGMAADEFARYFQHLARRVEQAVLSVPEESLWRKPFSFGNSIGHLVLHLTGNLNHYIGAMIGGTGYVRHREQEFTENSPPDTEALLARFREAVALVLQTLESQDDAGFLAPIEHNAPIQSRLGLYLVCASHMNNHIGQMSYLTAALQPEVKQEPSW